MRRAALPVIFAALLAGCTGAGEQPQLQSTPDGGGLGPAGSAADLSASGATGVSAAVNAATAWVREFWAERTEVVLVDETFTLSNTVETPVSGCLFSCDFPFANPAEGAMVAPGAERVEVAATFTRPATAPSAVVTMYYRTASAAEPQALELTSDEVVVLPVALEDADAPFAPRSLWWFAFNVQSPNVEHIPPFDITLRIVAHRGPVLPELPDLPDPWNGGTTIPLLVGYEAPEELSSFNPVTGYSCMNCNIGWDSQGSGLVPPEAAELQATVAWDWVTPTKPQLYAWNAVDEEGTAMELVEDGAQVRAFRLAVPPEQVDSPYQSRSHWGFYFTFDTHGLDVALMHGRAVVDVTVVKGA